MRISKLREVGEMLGREGMSQLAIQEIEKFDGSYKGAMELCGKLAVIAQISTCDDYWSEQVKRGKYKILDICEKELEKMEG